MMMRVIDFANEEAEVQGQCEDNKKSEPDTLGIHNQLQTIGGDTPLSLIVADYATGCETELSVASVSVGSKSDIASRSPTNSLLVASILLLEKSLRSIP